MSRTIRLAIALTLGLTLALVLALTPWTGVAFADDHPDGSTIE